MNLSGFGGTAQQLPYRQCMQNSAKTVQDTVINYINTQANSGSSLFETASKLISGTANGKERLGQAVIGTVNYVDYLLNFGNQQPAEALRIAVEVCVNGFVANLVLNSQFGSQLDNNFRYQLQQAVDNLGVAIHLVSQNIAPLIQNERTGNNLNTGGLQGGQIRRQGDGFGSNIGNTGAGLGAGQTGSLFSASQPAASGQGGGMVLGMDNVPPPAVTPAQTNAPAQTLGQSVSTQNIQTIQQQSNTVIYMDYSQHKTFGLLKKKLPSDTNRSLMPTLTLDSNLAAMGPVSTYTKLDGNVARKDITAPVGAGFALETIVLSYGQVEFSSLVNHQAAEVLQLNRKELERLMFTGILIQLIPEYIDRARLMELINRYNTGMVTHGRLTMMIEELETFLRPETILVIAEKITNSATGYWRYDMGQEAGGVSNYFDNHDAVTEYLRREPGMERMSQLWADFPARVLNEMLVEIKMEVQESEDGTAPEPTTTLGFQVGYIRVPFYAAELPIGVNTDDRKDFGIVLRNATPGLYNLCRTVYEAYPGCAHRVIMTNDGRLVNVVRPLLETTHECFYIHELKTLL